MPRSTPLDAEATFGLPVCGVIGIVPPPPWLRKKVRTGLKILVSVILLTAIGIGCMHVILWLQYPEQYAQWTAAPTAYLTERLGDAWADAWATVRYQWRTL